MEDQSYFTDLRMPRTKNVTGLGSIALTEEEENEVDEQAALAKENEEKFGYIRERSKEFPSIGDQLDYIFHNGLAKWKADIVQPVKDKFPKPE